MATVHPGSLIDERPSHSLSVVRLSAATGITAAVILLLCWLGTFVPFSSPTHAYISLFTNAEISSGLALAEGICWSLVFGLIVGAVFALIYNAAAPLGRK
jgi:predicted small integral membrane protein